MSTIGYIKGDTRSVDYSSERGSQHEGPWGTLKIRRDEDRVLDLPL